MAARMREREDMAARMRELRAFELKSGVMYCKGGSRRKLQQ